jgi:hypothetical protein
MKNIHVLPTEKKSVLIYTALAGYQMTTPQFTKSDLELIQAHYENIYITSDEEIKVGDWVIYQKFMFPLKVILDQDGYHIINNGIGEVVGDYYSLQERYYKIILTTDQDLIGVQAIDDDFLEWFVKNPSCESIKCINTWMYYPKKWEYKIIIPKEEAKQEFPKQNIIDNWLEKNGDPEITKQVEQEAKELCEQETLEEAAELALVFHNTYEKLAPSFGYETRQDTKEFDFKSNNGRLMVAVCSEVIKWQQEQDKNKFSEEDMKEAFKNGAFKWRMHSGGKCFEEWFEQFKKK